MGLEPWPPSCGPQGTSTQGMKGSERPERPLFSLEGPMWVVESVTKLAFHVGNYSHGAPASEQGWVSSDGDPRSGSAAAMGLLALSGPGCQSAAPARPRPRP